MKLQGVPARLAALLVCALAAAWLSAMLPGRWDVTSARQFTLGPATTSLLTGLRSDVHVTAYFLPGQPGRDEVASLLDQYARASSRVKVRVVDPRTVPSEALRVGATAGGLSVVEAQGRVRSTRGLSEDALTAALASAVAPRPSRLCAAAREGERDWSDAQGAQGFGLLARYLAADGYLLVPAGLDQAASSAPPACDAWLLADPRLDLGAAQLGGLDSLLRGGGRLLVFWSPDGQPALARALTPWGLTPISAQLSDPQASLASDPFTLETSQVGDRYPGTALLKGFRGLVLPNAAPIGTPPPQVALGVSSAAVLTSPAAVAGGPGQLPAPAPFAVAAASEVSAARPTRIVVVGSSDGFANPILGEVSANRDFVLASLSWLAEHQSVLLAGTSTPQTHPLLLTPARQASALLCMLVLLPGALLAFAWLAARARAAR